MNVPYKLWLRVNRLKSVFHHGRFPQGGVSLTFSCMESWFRLIFVIQSEESLAQKGTPFLLGDTRWWDYKRRCRRGEINSIVREQMVKKESLGQSVWIQESSLGTDWFWKEDRRQGFVQNGTQTWNVRRNVDLERQDEAHEKIQGVRWATISTPPHTKHLISNGEQKWPLKLFSRDVETQRLSHFTEKSKF